MIPQKLRKESCTPEVGLYGGITPNWFDAVGSHKEKAKLDRNSIIGYTYPITPSRTAQNGMGNPHLL